MFIAEGREARDMNNIQQVEGEKENLNPNLTYFQKEVRKTGRAVFPIIDRVIPS